MTRIGVYLLVHLQPQRPRANIMLIAKVPLPSETLKTRLLQWATTSSSYPFFKGSSKDLTSWFAIVERAAEENEIFDIQYSEAAIVFIQGDLAHVMEERQLRYLEKSGNLYWRWEEFKDDIRRVVLEAEKIMEEEAATPLDKTKAAFERFRVEHPYIFASAGAGLMVGGSLVIIPALGILALNAIGFTSTGVAGGSFAALIQSIFYRGATAGLFSILQSAGATAVMPAAGAIAGASSAIGAGVASLLYGSKKDSNNGSPDPSPPNTDSPPPPYPGYASHLPVNYAVYRSKRSKSPSSS
ncbi:hypothetical protein EST38_g4944 [Candolleomyces aberdarensis]|uniref:Uncharacterized protein n=1 Tax=Candolleomyces aberdarensis TaxID=2316362 RepID=A0A4Q2DPP1_9AGAR|nr:hypothetical protein EST38_g4944 [Candolleomyces aberdarensis]